MGGAIPVAVTAVGAAAGAGAGAAATGRDSDGDDKKGGEPTDEDACQDEADEDANSEGPVDKGMRTGPNRCPECKRRGERYCRHMQE
jgi:hypothetical protein